MNETPDTSHTDSMSIANLTVQQIKELIVEAAGKGDDLPIAICDRALGLPIRANLQLTADERAHINGMSKTSALRMIAYAVR